MLDGRSIERLRPPKNPVDPYIPYHFLQETEPDANGRLQKVNTIFLTGKECAFKCLMCDLWKNTLDKPTQPGAIRKQLDYAFERLPEAKVIKLYNSSNFFDPKAVPAADRPAIAERLKNYERVIVENHPNLTGITALRFNDLLYGQLEVAMGLETIHPEALYKLNKQLTADDFARAANFLRANAIDVRAFVLLNPPHLLGRDENIKWAIESVKFAFDNGAQCCTIIPTRPGNGIMDLLEIEGNYVPPTLDMLEEVFELALSLKQGRVFADTWDIGFTSDCLSCFEYRVERLNDMNLNQRILPKMACNSHTIHE
jgi:radical SAM enzyme (TIGR01210 family)